MLTLKCCGGNAGLPKICSRIQAPNRKGDFGVPARHIYQELTTVYRPHSPRTILARPLLKAF